MLVEDGRCGRCFFYLFLLNMPDEQDKYSKAAAYCSRCGYGAAHEPECLIKGGFLAHPKLESTNYLDCMLKEINTF